MERLSDRLARIEQAGVSDPRDQRDLEMIRSQMARIEGKLLRIAKRRSNWTRVGLLEFLLVDDEEA